MAVMFRTMAEPVAGGRWAAGSAATAWETARTWPGVVPQQPPTRVAPAAMNRGTASAKTAGQTKKFGECYKLPD